jgi:hypothetical protein
MSINFLYSKGFVLPYFCFALFPQTFPPILTEIEGDGIESRLSSYIFSTLIHLLEQKQKTL